MEQIKSKNVKIIIKVFWIFLLGSFLGSIIESGYTLIHANKLEIRKGLIYGLFVQVYGIGAIAYYLLCNKTQKTYKIFIMGMMLGGIVEYLCSFLQEIFLGTVSWDYSNNFLNFNGRTSLKYCIYWGIIAIIFLKFIYPMIQKLDKIVFNKAFIVITISMMIYMSLNLWISAVAIMREEERKINIPAQTRLDEFLDKQFPDELLEKVYQNRKSFNKIKTNI